MLTPLLTLLVSFVGCTSDNEHLPESDGNDNSAVNVAHEDFRIHDCRQVPPSEVSRQGIWWAIDGTVYGIMVDAALPDDKASPVYAWYDSKTLHIHLS